MTSSNQILDLRLHFDELLLNKHLFSHLYIVLICFLRFPFRDLKGGGGGGGALNRGTTVLLKCILHGMSPFQKFITISKTIEEQYNCVAMGLYNTGLFIYGVLRYTVIFETCI